MRREAILIAIGIALGAFGSASASFLPAEGEFTALFGSLEWKSTCRKPDWPSLQSASEFEIASAKTDYEFYQRCLIRQAGADSKYAQDAIIESAKNELQRVQRDAEIYGWSFN